MYKRQPNPEVLNSLFYRYEVDPKDVAIVGDTANDIQTGVNAQLGLKIAVLTGVGLEEEFAKADYIFDNVNDIVDVLK